MLLTCVVELRGGHFAPVAAQHVHAPPRPHIPDPAVVVKGAGDDEVACG